MKRRIPLLIFLLATVAELVALGLFAAASPELTQDVVAVNEIVKTVTRDFAVLDEHENRTKLDYVVLDTDGNVLYRTKSGLSESANAAIAHRDTVLAVTVDGVDVGTIVVYNDGAQTLGAQKRAASIALAIAVALSAALCIGYAAYMHVAVVRPFGKLKGFAERVASGNLDVPLQMDRRNLFGAFTESFDLMRTELKKARLAEARARQSKKELVAQLSHDIKTPVASIKAVSEVGLTVATGERERESFARIIGKADQIDTLVSNLFTATLEELQQLTVAPDDVASTRIKTMLENSDCLHRAVIPDLPECLVSVDPLRLQQVFDNLFSNAYKYAGTRIVVSVRKTERTVEIAVEDFGGGVPPEELPRLKEKYGRGGNARGVAGAGLGLYISDCFMREMRGDLRMENGAHGLKATVCLPLSGKT